MMREVNLLSLKSAKIASVLPLLSKIIGKSYWQLAPRFSSPPELLHDTTWEEAQEDITLATFPNMVPIPFGAVIPEGITPGDEVIEVFGAISAEHGEWAKLITDQIKQSESDNDHVTIYWRIMEARVLRGERDPARTATAGIRTMVIPTTNPFIETT